MDISSFLWCVGYLVRLQWTRMLAGAILMLGDVECNSTTDRVSICWIFISAATDIITPPAGLNVYTADMPMCGNTKEQHTHAVRSSTVSVFLSLYLSHRLVVINHNNGKYCLYIFLVMCLSCLIRGSRNFLRLLGVLFVYRSSCVTCIKLYSSNI